MTNEDDGRYTEQRLICVDNDVVFCKTFKYAFESIVVLSFSCAADDDVVQQVLHARNATDEICDNLLKVCWSTAESKRKSLPFV